MLKLAAQDAGSRATGVGLGAYQREIRFYRELPRASGSRWRPATPRSYDDDEGWFTLVLEDVAPAHQGDQIAGCSREEARLAMRELARIHAPVLGDLALAASDWLNQPSPLNQALLAQLLPGFLERYGDRVAPEHRELCERFVESRRRLDRRPPAAAGPRPRRLPHRQHAVRRRGRQRPLTVVDWQTVSLRPGDDGRLATSSAAASRSRTGASTRRSCVRAYHAELQAARRRRLRLGRVLGGVPAPVLPRRADGDRGRRWWWSGPSAATTCS